MASLDYMKQGKIKYTDFLIATLDKKRVLDAELQFIAFKHFDFDNDGFINVQDLRQALENTGDSASQQEIEEMIADWDLDNNRLIDFEEFKTMMNDRKLYPVPENQPSEIPSRSMSKRGSKIRKTITKIAVPFS